MEQTKMDVCTKNVYMQQKTLKLAFTENKIFVIEKISEEWTLYEIKESTNSNSIV